MTTPITRTAWMSLLLCLGAMATPLAAHDNPAKDSEHEALMDLVPTTSATAIALTSGTWSNAGIWSSGTVPGAGDRVVIPTGLTVTYDGNTTAELAWLRVEGTLEVSRAVSTVLRIDTIAILPGGAWVQGTEADPLPVGITSQIVFTDHGPIDRLADPHLLGRGFISHGRVAIHGQPKTGWATLGAAHQGDTHLDLDQAPQGWAVGDTVILTGSVMYWGWGGTPVTQDEIRVITAIAGTVVTLDRPLSFHHLPPQGASPQRLTNALGNYSRSIRFSSANTSFATNDDIQRHGHFMCMHSTQVGISYAAFDDLGRSNKTILVDDVEPKTYADEHVDPDGTVHHLGDPLIGTGTNPRGRYSLHLHLCGSDEDPTTADGSGSQHPYNKPIKVVGCSVLNGPGWGFVNHDSHVRFIDCVSYHLLGSGFVEESGNGIGVFQGCLSIRNGSGLGNASRANGDWRESLYNLDLGAAGHGFFYRGNMVDTIGCFAASCDSAAYAWNAKHGRGGSPITAQNMPYPAITNGEEVINWDQTPISIFRDCTAIASWAGAFEYYSQPRGDGRSLIERFLAWNIFMDGIQINYGNDAGKVTVRDSVVIKLSQADSPVFMPDSAALTKGLQTRVSFSDVVYDNVYVHGFAYGLVTDNQGGGVKRVQILDNTRFVSCTTTIADLNVIPENPPAHAQVLPTPSEHTTLSFVPDPGLGDPGNPLTNITQPFELKGTKTDSLGTERTGDNPASQDLFERKFVFSASALQGLLAKGYHQDAQGTFLILPYAITHRVTGAVKTLYHRLYLTLDAPFVAGLGDRTVGRNLGAFIDPGTTRAPAPDLSVAGGRYTGPQAVVLSTPLPGAFFFYTVDGSDPTIDADFQPIGTTRRATGPIVVGSSTVAGSVTLRAITAAGVMERSAITTAVYTVTPVTTQAPSFSIGSGSYAGPQSLVLSCATPGAVIRYTVDGSTPGPSVGLAASGPIPVTGTLTIKALATSPGLPDSPIVSAAFSIDPAAPTTAAPVFSLAGGSYSAIQTLTLSSATAGASIRFTRDGSLPSSTNGILVTGPITVDRTSTFRAVAYQAGFANSAITEATYAVTLPALTGTLLGSGTGGGSNGWDRAVDGNTTTFFEDIVHQPAWVGLDLGAERILTQIRFVPRSGFAGRMVGGVFQACTTSDFRSGVVDLGSITTTPPAGQTTLDLTNPQAFRYVRYRSPTNGYGNVAEIAFAGVPVTVVGDPVFSLGGGTYAGPQLVPLSCPTPGATIRYTIDGSLPSATTGLVYSAPIPISASVIIAAMAVAPGMTDSSVVTVDYRITTSQPLVAMPVISPNGGLFDGHTHVTISSTTPGSTIRYTTDGSVPSATSGVIYTGEIHLLETTTLQAIAILAGSRDSSVTTATFTADVTPPAAPVVQALPSVSANPRPTFQGTAEPGSQITLAESGITLATITVDGTGTWTITPAALAEGLHDLIIFATDAVGNVSSSVPVSLRIDTSAPAAPVITSSPTSPTPTPTWAGTAEIGARVLVLDGSTIVATAMAAPLTGAWSATISGLSAGVHHLAIVVEDGAGNRSTSVGVTVTVTAPAAGGSAGNGGTSGGGCGLGSGLGLAALFLARRRRPMPQSNGSRSR